MDSAGFEPAVSADFLYDKSGFLALIEASLIGAIATFATFGLRVKDPPSLEIARKTPSSRAARCAGTCRTTGSPRRSAPKLARKRARDEAGGWQVAAARRGADSRFATAFPSTIGSVSPQRGR